jgi:hypothetical protein
MLVLADSWLNPFEWSTTDWTALTFLVLLGAALAALRQVGEARKLREARIRPFVSVHFELQRTIVNMVIRNTGATLARDLTFEFDPPLRSSRDSIGGRTPLAEAPIFKTGIPSLTPGHSIVFVFDSSIEMVQLGLPLTYRLTLSYTGEPLNKRYTEETILDLNVHRDVARIARKDVHDVAEQLESIATEMKKWTVGNALRVMRPEDVRARDEELDQLFAQRQAEASVAVEGSTDTT